MLPGRRLKEYDMGISVLFFFFLFFLKKKYLTARGGNFKNYFEEYFFSSSVYLWNYQCSSVYHGAIS